VSEAAAVVTCRNCDTAATVDADGRVSGQVPSILGPMLFTLHADSIRTFDGEGPDRFEWDCGSCGHPIEVPQPEDEDEDA